MVLTRLPALLSQGLAKPIMVVLLLGNLSDSVLRFRGALLRALIAEGHQVHVATPGLTDDRSTSDLLRDMGVTCHDVFMSRTGTNPVADVRTLLSIVMLMRRIRPDVSLGYTIKPVIYGLLGGWVTGVPKRFALVNGLGYALADEVVGWRRRLLQGLVLSLYRLAMRHASGVFFQNPDDAALFLNRGLLPGRVRSIVVNGSGVPTDAYAVVALPQTPPSFVLIARLLVEKGIREYVAAARLIRASHPAVVFHLVGGVDANPGAISAAEVQAWQDEGVVRWHGQLHDVRPVLASAHVFVLPSFYREGTPRTVLEAMSMGRPIVTTDMPGCRETVVEGENGFLVPPRAADALAAAMLRFVDDPALVARMGMRSRQLAEDKYDVRKVNAVMISAMGL